MNNNKITAPVFGINTETFDTLPGVIGSIPFLVYTYLARHARTNPEPVKVGNVTVGQYQTLRSQVQIAAGLALHRSQVSRALSDLESSGLVKVEKADRGHLCSVVAYASEFSINLATSQQQLSNNSATSQQQVSNKSAPILSNTINHSITNNKNTNSSTTSRSTTKARRKRSTSSSSQAEPATLKLIPKEEYKGIQIPNWKIPPENPLDVKPLPFCPPNQRMVGEPCIPLLLGELNPPKPGTELTALDVYEAIFWVRPTQIAAMYPYRENLWDMNQFSKLEAWAIARREEFHTSKHYSDHTTWLLSKIEKPDGGPTHDQKRYGARTC